MMGERKMLPGWMGSLGIAAWVWYWDSKHHSISSWWWGRPLWLRAAVWTYIAVHLIFKYPKRILIRW